MEKYEKIGKIGEGLEEASVLGLMWTGLKKAMVLGRLRS